MGIVDSSRGGSADNTTQAEQAVLRYFAALCHARVALGAALGDNMMFSFAWRDAFQPATVVCASRACDFERVAVLYNLGAAYSQRASTYVWCWFLLVVLVLVGGCIPRLFALSPSRRAPIYHPDPSTALRHAHLLSRSTTHSLSLSLSTAPAPG